MSLRLTNGDKVCIIGGGPGGSLAALHLLKLARQEELRLEVLIFEPRNFSLPGPVGCNRCAGILSSRLLQGLESLGITLPDEVIQAELHSYAAHLDGEVVRIVQPDSQRRIVSVYRSGGPRLLKGEPLTSFDGFLLNQAILQGAQHVPSRIHKVTWQGSPVIRTARERFQADLVVLATGVNSRSPLSPDFGYHPPQTAVMAQDEIFRPPTWPEDQVNVYFKKPPGLIFGALIPKGNYVNISLLGEGLTKDTVEDFIDMQGLGVSLPDSPNSLCGCTPRIAVSSARGFFGTRWVAVGDAAVTRLYKDGIGSAFHTAKTAMQVAIRHGVSHRAFQKKYAPFCRKVARDNLYGRLLFYVWNLSLRSPALIRVLRNTIRMETEGHPEQRVNIRLLWGMFTGDEAYRDLFWQLFRRDSLRNLIRGRRTPDSRKRE